MATSSRNATLKRKAAAVRENADQLAKSHEELRRYVGADAELTHAARNK